MTQRLNEILNIEYPIILAPMFLISNVEMTKIALDSGISAAIPAMNYRTEEELEYAISQIKAHSAKDFGINIITNRSNKRFNKQLDVILKTKPAYIISSLGNPKELIQEAHKLDIKVFCDVVDLSYAKKVENLGADAVIAVNNKAGGHAGLYSQDKLLTQLLENCSIPVVSAGGISKPEKLRDVFKYNIAGVSIGTVFIASHEAPVSKEYKNALINNTAKDIVLTTRLSGTPSTVINTDYVKRTGLKPNFYERLISLNPFIKRNLKSILMKRGMSKLRKAAFSSNYKKIWCAGPSIEDIHKIQRLDEIIDSFTRVFKEYDKY